ncbi:MAG: hypothetical protein ACLSVD_14745 [Eggerthellaceae bacterium]
MTRDARIVSASLSSLPSSSACGRARSARYAWQNLLAHLADGRLVQRQAERLGPFAPVVCIGIVVLSSTAIIPAELGIGSRMRSASGRGLCLPRQRAWDAGHQKGRGVTGFCACWFRLGVQQGFGNSPRFELLVFLCFLVPGLPKDVMTYAAALANMPIRHLVLVTTVGRILHPCPRWHRRLPPAAIESGRHRDGCHRGAQRQAPPISFCAARKLGWGFRRRVAILMSAARSRSLTAELVARPRSRRDGELRPRALAPACRTSGSSPTRKRARRRGVR